MFLFCLFTISPTPQLGWEDSTNLEPLEFKTNQRGIYIVAKGVKWLLQSSPDT